MTQEIRPLRWIGGIEGHLLFVDQTQLPGQLVEIVCYDVGTLVEAIQSLRIRGAPALGIAAAYGLCLGVQPVLRADAQTFFRSLEETASRLLASRPTAVNPSWAVSRMLNLAKQLENRPPPEIASLLLAEARAIHEEDLQTSKLIGLQGAKLFGQNWGILTHCNTGGLATGGGGTALAVIFAAARTGKRPHVFADETRPLLQGARLTAWELQQRGIAVTVISDSAAAGVMRQGRVQAVIVGADRIAASGDTANKIGTYGLAVLAAAHHIPFFVAAPWSTFDFSLADGSAIPIEQRDPREVSEYCGRRTVPEGVEVFNPAFDVTPAGLITAIICERGVIQPVNQTTIRAMCQTPQ